MPKAEGADAFDRCVSFIHQGAHYCRTGGSCGRRYEFFEPTDGGDYTYTERVYGLVGNILSRLPDSGSLELPVYQKSDCRKTYTECSVILAAPFNGRTIKPPPSEKDYVGREIFFQLIIPALRILLEERGYELSILSNRFKTLEKWYPKCITGVFEKMPVLKIVRKGNGRL